MAKLIPYKGNIDFVICPQTQNPTERAYNGFHPFVQLGLVADPVIEVIARLEFEDDLESSLEAAGALRAAAPSLGSIPNPWGCRLVLEAVWLSQGPSC